MNLEIEIILLINVHTWTSAAIKKKSWGQAVSCFSLKTAKNVFTHSCWHCKTFFIDCPDGQSERAVRRPLTIKSGNTGKLQSFLSTKQILTRWFKLTSLFKRMAKQFRSKLDSAPYKHLIHYSLGFFCSRSYFLCSCCVNRLIYTVAQFSSCSSPAERRCSLSDIQHKFQDNLRLFTLDGLFPWNAAILFLAKEEKISLLRCFAKYGQNAFFFNHWRYFSRLVFRRGTRRISGGIGADNTDQIVGW